MTWQANWAQNVEGFSGAKRVLEIGAGAFATAIYLAKKFPEKEVFGIDFELSDAALTNLRSSPSNLTVIKADARDFSMLSDGYFDFAFSVAVTEHIHELAIHLQETHNILRRGGRYAYWQSPFWSCSMGHHYKHWMPDCPIPHYGHLYMTPAEIRKHVAALKRNADEIDHMIFRRGDLARLTRSQVESITYSSPFAVKEWVEEEDQHYTLEAAQRVLENNLYGVAASDLKVKGAKVVLERVI